MRIEGIEQMQQEAARFVHEDLSEVRLPTATVVALSGDLGAGKTTFAQYMAQKLGITETVTSPTYVLEKIYGLEGQKFKRLIHIDAYRLESAHELEILGWRSIVEDPENLILIEWPERVAELVPSDAIRISLEGSGDSRELTYGKEEN